MLKRKLVHIDAPEGEPGFLGAGHTARRVIQRSFEHSDPFIMLMDDMLDKKDNTPAGGPHPHAGFETGTLIIEGELGSGEERMGTGDFQLMTAGSGIVHTEIIDKPIKMRILQLWLSLPKGNRWAEPRVQDISAAHVPTMTEKGISVKLYSGSFAGLISPVLNHTPFILADVSMDQGVSSLQELPANYNTLIYVLAGKVMVGDDGQLLNKDEVGWLDIYGDEGMSELSLVAGNEGARFLVYAGKPTGDPIKPYGPFIGNDSQDIIRLYQEYNQGKMKHVTLLPAGQRIVL
jgi:redox-sensitive bicupin YhaK (pirin superfamily)